jgi:hypothetical protein
MCQSDGDVVLCSNHHGNIERPACLGAKQVEMLLLVMQLPPGTYSCLC